MAMVLTTRVVIAGRRSRMRPCARPSWGRSSRGGGALRLGEPASAVLAHQVAVARDIGHKDRRQPAFNLLPAHLVMGPQKTLLLRLRFNPTPSEGEFIVPDRLRLTLEPVLVWEIADRLDDIARQVDDLPHRRR